MEKTGKRLDILLGRIRGIERMERGKICRMSGRAHFNHQHWENGRNVVRYVPASLAPSLQEAIDGYQRFMDLVGQYADEVVARTRKELGVKPPAKVRAKARGKTRPIKGKTSGLK